MCQGLRETACKYSKRECDSAALTLLLNKNSRTYGTSEISESDVLQEGLNQLGTLQPHVIITIQKGEGSMISSVHTDRVKT